MQSALASVSVAACRFAPRRVKGCEWRQLHALRRPGAGACGGWHAEASIVANVSLRVSKISPLESGARRLITRAASTDRPNAPQPQNTPLWLWVFFSIYSAVKDALQFLWEQPGQLQYIEWPSLQSTVKMAMLTVVVVTLLIIFLTTIDSSFSFVLSSVLRRVQ